MPKYTKAAASEARAFLASRLRPSKPDYTRTDHPTRGQQRVYFLIRSVAKSGMSRVISTYVNDADGSMVCLDHAIAIACGYRELDGGGVRVGGCGMDMRFALLDEATHAAGLAGFSANDYVRESL